MKPAVLASAASVMLSWYYFYVQGDREQGLFIGLWAPTILAFAGYIRQEQMRERLETTTGKRLKNRLESVMKAQ